MNKIKYITIAAIAALVMTSCEKEEVQTDFSNGISSNSVSIANEITARTYKKYANITDAEFFQVINPIKKQLIENKQLSLDKSGEAIPLGDIFFFYEGAINSIHSQQLDPESEVENFYSSFEVPIFIEENQYFVQVSDYNTFYSQILFNIQTEVNLSANQYLVVADLSLTNVTSSTATINVMLSVGTSVSTGFPVLTPGGEVHGANLSGWCGTSNSQGVDATTFLNSYLYSQGTASTTICPAGQSRSLILISTWVTNNLGQNNLIFGSYVNIGNFYWQSFTNSCIGNNSNTFDNEAQWMDLFSDAMYNVDQARDYFRIQTGQQSLEYMYAIIFSGNQNNSYSNNQGRPFHHYGSYYYGIVFCQ